ncbi:homeobox protein notochord-like [Oculina patagonica]
MSTRSGTLVKESLAMVSVKSKVDFDSPGVETELLRPPTWKTAKSCRLDFGEHDPFAPLHCPDLLPNPIDVDSVTKTSHKEKRTIYDADQKATLEAMFRKKKFLTRKEEATLAAQLGININKVQTWFNNRRQKWRKEQKKGAVRPSGLLPVLSRSVFNSYFM